MALAVDLDVTSPDKEDSHTNLFNANSAAQAMLDLSHSSSLQTPTGSSVAVPSGSSTLLDMPADPQEFVVDFQEWLCLSEKEYYDPAAISSLIKHNSVILQDLTLKDEFRCKALRRLG